MTDDVSLEDQSQLADYALTPDDYRAAILDALRETNVHLEQIARALKGQFDDE
jgi:hypothetical protein